jgi:transcriptional regulator with XRE-family HTH domain
MMLDSLSHKIGDNIRKIRMKRTLSQAELGELSGHSTNYIGAIERGEKNVSVVTLYSIAKALEISLEAFFSLVDPTENRNLEMNQLYSDLSNDQKALILNLMKEMK